MKNIIMLQKDENGNIYCEEISEKGIKCVEECEENSGYWKEGGTIVLEELEEILDKEI